jgi:N-acetylmuramoyl-L-alanine amidase
MLKRKTTQWIVIHCSATRVTQDIGVAEIRKMHLARGFADIGYNLVIRRNGVVETGRGQDAVGAHVEGYNSRSCGICLVGGVGPDGKKAENNFTPEQFTALRQLLRKLKKDYPTASIVGHRDLSPDRNKDGKITPDEWLKMCPSFSVREWLTKNPI